MSNKFNPILIFFLFLLQFLFPQKINAKDFLAFHKTTYEFSEQGIVYVMQEVSLVNQTPNLYVSQYSISLKGPEISKIEGYDKIGPLKIETEIRNDNTLIKLNFNEQVVGEGKILSFVLKYQIKNLAIKEGNLWEITIPKLFEEEETNEYQVVLKVPVTFGKLSIANPYPQQIQKDNRFTILFFDDKEAIKKGITVTFGQYQVYSLQINYELYNSQNKPVNYLLALPPDTNYQTIYYDKFSPLPQKIDSDNDGNWIASFLLKPNEKVNLEIQGFVKVFLQSQKKQILNIYSEKHLLPTLYWETENDEIQKLSRELKSPRDIYNFVVKSLIYDKNAAETKTISRKGAVSALKNPQKATCSQFTDLFIALCRASKIPAREVVGWAKTEVLGLSQEKVEILHSWPEYFDEKEKIWRSVDPTWENTTKGWDYFNRFDMNHIAFVIHGENDSSPFPITSNSENHSNVYISISEFDFQSFDNAFSIISHSPNNIFSLKPNLLTLTIRNNSGMAFYDLVFKSNTPELQNKEWKINRILPFSNFSIKTTAYFKEKWKDYSQQVNLNLNNESIEYKIPVLSFAFRTILISSLFFSIIILATTISLKKEKNIERKN